MFAQQCKQMNISINAVFRKDRLNSQNAAPVHLRLTQNRKLKHISTGVTLNINEWDFENQRVMGQTPELQALQLRIDTKIDELRRKIKRLEALEVEVTLDNLLAYIIHSGFISGYQNRYGDNLKPPTNVYHRMTA